MKKVLVTGGNGFIGTVFCKKLRENGYPFRVLTNMETPFFAPETMVIADLCDSEKIESLLNEFQPDVIVHLAAIASPVYGDAASIYRVNVCGTESLLKAAVKCLPKGTRVILTSTAGVYGNQDVPYLYETLPFNPPNHYGISKVAVEIMSRQYTDDLNIQIIRPFNIISSGQNANFLVPKLVNAFRKRQETIQLGNLNVERDFVSVGFIANVIFDLCNTDKVFSPALNICSGIATSCGEIIATLERLTGHHIRVETVDAFVRKNDIWRMIGDTTLLDTLVQGRYKSEDVETILQTMLTD